MTLDAAKIKSRLAAVPSNKKDDEARKIVHGATNGEVKSLNIEAVLRLYEALCMLGPRYYSGADAAAMKNLATLTQFQPVTKTPDFGVKLVKAARAGKNNVQLELTPQLVTRIYAAENKRLSLAERAGIDGSTVGRGQLGQPAYEDVKKPRHFKSALEKCFGWFHMSKLLSNHGGNPMNAPSFDMATYKVRVPPHYRAVWRTPELEDFVVAAYLAIRIEAATKPGRSSKDAARFAVALYHGMRDMVVAAQTTVKNQTLWAPVQALLIGQGHTDEVSYVNEVVK